MIRFYTEFNTEIQVWDVVALKNKDGKQTQWISRNYKTEDLENLIYFVNKVLEENE